MENGQGENIEMLKQHGVINQSKQLCDKNALNDYKVLKKNNAKSSLLINKIQQK